MSASEGCSLGSYQCTFDNLGLFFDFFVPTMSRSRVLGQFQEKARPSAIPSEW